MAPDTARTRVLVVDDEPSIRDIVRGFLEKEGLEVGEAVDGPTAVEIARQTTPDVVVLDHRMPPGPSGLDVARLLSVERPALRVVIYSNYQDVDLVRRASELGVPFLPKGNLNTLRSAVRD